MLLGRRNPLHVGVNLLAVDPVLDGNLRHPPAEHPGAERLARLVEAESLAQAAQGDIHPLACVDAATAVEVQHDALLDDRLVATGGFLDRGVAAGVDFPVDVDGDTALGAVLRYPLADGGFLRDCGVLALGARCAAGAACCVSGNVEETARIKCTHVCSAPALL